MTSVVQYSSATSPPHKNILQQNTGNNERREVIVMRKPHLILPQPKDEILLTNTASAMKKKAKTTKDNSIYKTSPQPVAVARRNARERNRVKQVNNGFANLRQHIPNFIAAAFETNTGRGGNKKLSKVETLRMAVEYIRSLEDILAIDENSENNISSPTPSNQTNISYNTYPLLSPSADEDDLTSTPPPSQQQYIRINTSSLYQIMPTNLYENGENMDPMVEDGILLTDQTLIDPNLEFNVAYLNSMHTNASLSPGMYSDQSLSPQASSLEIKSDCFIPVFNTPPQPRLIGQQDEIHIKVEALQDLPVLSLKTENEIPDDVKNNVIDVMQWWEQQQQQPPQTTRS